MKKLLLITLSTVMLWSCEDDVDTTKPTITVESPEAEAKFDSGAELTIKATLQDDGGLKSYKINIHSGKDGHKHKVANIPLQKLAKEDHDHKWEYNHTKDLNGEKTYTVVHNLTLGKEGDKQEEIEGEYHIGIFATDSQGNQEEKFVTIDVHHHEDDKK